MSYTGLCLLALAVSVLLDVVVLRTWLVSRKAFWVSYAIMVFFQLLTNGWLTGRGVVRYDPAAVLGGGDAVAFGHWRVLYAPVEDLAFGFALILQTLSWWVFWGRRGVQRRPPRSARGGRVPARSLAPGEDGTAERG
ncbi:lycopene cyclase domain-containing protein [Angustibacter sp. McL0619]|uniref:lycopene cyclase domain-containing protein n=1 Tax=Angustibacter sp. McL0619 TaxID=3415676 RepID=UPI003CF9AD78